MLGQLLEQSCHQLATITPLFNQLHTVYITNTILLCLFWQWTTMELNPALISESEWKWVVNHPCLSMMTQTPVISMKLTDFDWNDKIYQNEKWLKDRKRTDMTYKWHKLIDWERETCVCIYLIFTFFNILPIYLYCLLFCSSHFSFLVLGHFWRRSYENTKILRNVCLHFARQDGQDGKNGKKFTQLKWPKYQKPKGENMGWTKHKVVFLSLVWNRDFA